MVVALPGAVLPKAALKSGLLVLTGAGGLSAGRGWLPVEP